MIIQFSATQACANESNNMRLLWPKAKVLNSTQPMEVHSIL